MTDEPLYHYIKGKGWVTGPERTPEEILNAYTHDKHMARIGRNCTTCNEFYSSHCGDSCDYPYVGREWTD